MNTPFDINFEKQLIEKETEEYWKKTHGTRIQETT